jgi:hypothetical protein
VLGSDEEYVVFTLAGHLDVGYIERLSVDIAVDRQSEDFSKLLRINVLRREDFFVEVGPSASVVILRGPDLRME